MTKKYDYTTKNLHGKGRECAMWKKRARGADKLEAPTASLLKQGGGESSARVGALGSLRSRALKQLQLARYKSAQSPVAQSSSVVVGFS
jgi:hypothetical protein